MSHDSASELLILHAVRLLGFANSDGIATRAGTSAVEVSCVLDKADTRGWVQHLGFADLEGWSLTDTGRAENERQLAAERQLADPENTIAAVYGEFLPLNTRLVRAVTDWQINPTSEDQFAPNDHSDPAWDGRILNELTTLGTDLAPLVQRLTDVLTRFNGYAERYRAALRRAVNGEPDWIDKTDVDSCHRVWFQLHEDLVATLGIDRGTEFSDDRA